MLNNEPGGSQTGDTDATETSTPTKDELSKLKNGEHQEVTNASKEGDDLALDNPFGGPDDEIPDEGSLVEETEQDVEQASDENVFDYEEYDLEKQSDEGLLCSNAKMAMVQVGRQTCQVWWHCNGGCRCEIVNRRRRQGWCRYNRISPGYYGGGNRCKMGKGGVPEYQVALATIKRQTRTLLAMESSQSLPTPDGKRSITDSRSRSGGQNHGGAAAPKEAGSLVQHQRRPPLLHCGELSQWCA